MKSGEIDYLKNIGPQGSKDAFDKPFSDATRPKNLVDIGVVLALLPQPPARILDLGCGTGWTSWFLAKSGYDVVGQDIAQDMIDLAVKNGERYGTSSAKFVVSDYESAEYHEEFDAALFYDSLHHAEDEGAAIRCAFRALKPGGALVTHEPGRGHFDSEPSRHAMKEYGVNEKDMPPSRIFALGREAGFSSFRRMVDPTHLCLAAYGVDLQNGTRLKGVVEQIKWGITLLRRALNPDDGAICVLQK
jgi:SAM-dependent methyltransferase